MFKDMPEVRSVEAIRKESSPTMSRAYVEGHPVFVAARMRTFRSRGFVRDTLRRAYLAWLVFTGRCDALYWGVDKP